MPLQMLSLSLKFSSFNLAELLPKYRRFVLPVLLFCLLSLEETQDIVLSAMADAFWQVAVFVAATLTIYHFFADKVSRLYLNEKGFISPYREIGVASLLGVLPGCGGAIIVITQYVSGRMSFGAVVAVLTSTMGDAAFLLLAVEPLTGGGIIILCLVGGILSGWAVNKIHGNNFLRHTVDQKSFICGQKIGQSSTPRRLKIQATMWKWLMLPGGVIGLMFAAQIEVAEVLGISERLIMFLGSGLTLVFICLWAATTEVTSYESVVAEDKKSKQAKAFQRVALDTNFVVSWVVLAFVSFELVMHFGQLDLTQAFTMLGSAAPLVGVLVGMIPGCGPQIITTSLYLSGAIPLSAQIGNAISNDGDALFPAIALSPKVALVATFYSAVPALVASYTYYRLFEV